MHTWVSRRDGEAQGFPFAFGLCYNKSGWQGIY